MDISDASVSGVLFLVEPILLEVWLALFKFFVPTNHVIHFQTFGMSLSLKFTSVEKINCTFLLQDFRFCFCKYMVLFVLQLIDSSGLENLTNVSPFP